MKLLKSRCGNAWLFDAAKHNDEITAGLACFLPGCAENIEVEVRGMLCRVIVPHRAINSPVPVKVSNARLSLLIVAPHE